MTYEEEVEFVEALEAAGWVRDDLAFLAYRRDHHRLSVSIYNTGYMSDHTYAVELTDSDSIRFTAHIVADTKVGALDAFLRMKIGDICGVPEKSARDSRRRSCGNSVKRV